MKHLWIVETKATKTWRPLTMWRKRESARMYVHTQRQLWPDVNIRIRKYVAAE